ncbi:MAG: AraC family transcriptional regulator [Tannerellaceae bacterium]|nr:AraC family transcriptional regulator [Tannerellaceae bacterium]
MMEKIRTHRIAETFKGEFAFIKTATGNRLESSIDYAHADDYYIFILLEKGHLRFMIDFKECEVTAGSIYCLLPGQVHFPLDISKPFGWFLAVDSMVVKDEYKEILEKVSVIESKPRLQDEQMQELSQCLSIIQKRLIPGRQPIEQHILHDLISCYIGMVAQLYQHAMPVSANNRLATITFQFKALVSIHYQSWKRPSEYASALNISPVYLNEAVKKTTGLTVSDWIQNEIVLRAKRLLYYTDMSIKEIALQLGYEDWAYFTRLFTKVASVPPTRFRKNYLK